MRRLLPSSARCARTAAAGSTACSAAANTWAIWGAFGPKILSCMWFSHRSSHLGHCSMLSCPAHLYVWPDPIVSLISVGGRNGGQQFFESANMVRQSGGHGRGARLPAAAWLIIDGLP